MKVHTDIGVRELQHAITEFSDRVFPDRTLESTMLKLTRDEIPEFLQRPTDAGEYADLIILLLDVASQQGIDVAVAVRNKMIVNENREWSEGEDGTYQHKPQVDCRQIGR